MPCRYGYRSSRELRWIQMPQLLSIPNSQVPGLVPSLQKRTGNSSSTHLFLFLGFSWCPKPTHSTLKLFSALWMVVSITAMIQCPCRFFSRCIGVPIPIRPATCRIPSELVVEPPFPRDGLMTKLDSTLTNIYNQPFQQPNDSLWG
jgi:hypothetical protein